MMTQTVTLDLPELLYQKLRLRAAQAQRTIEDELLEVLATAVPLTDDLPADLSIAITPLATLNGEPGASANCPLPLPSSTVTVLTP